MTPILVVLVALATGARTAVPAVVPLAPWAGLLRSVTVTVDGTAHPFVFDTGGGETVITPEVAAAVGCTPYGRSIGFRMSGERVEFEYCDNVALRLGQVALAREPVGVYDLKSILPVGLPRADGVLSLRSLRDSPVTVALGAGHFAGEEPLHQRYVSSGDTNPRIPDTIFPESRATQSAASVCGASSAR